MTFGELYYREYAPHARLAPFVRAYFTFDSSSAALGRALRKFIVFRDASAACPALFADAACSLVIKHGTWSVDGLSATDMHAAVIGPQTSGRTTRVGSDVSAVGAYFRIGALGDFSNIPTVLLVDEALSLCDAFDGEVRSAAESICEASDSTGRLDTLERLLMQLLRSAPRRSRSSMDSMRVSEIATNRFSIDRLAKRYGVSRQYLTRRFRERFGIAPKLLSRIARFHGVLRSLPEQAPNWAELAFEHGYTDQSHLIAEFREFTTLTPATFIAAQRAHPFAA